MQFTSYALATVIMLSGCNRSSVMAQPALDIELSREFIEYEGKWHRPNSNTIYNPGGPNTNDGISLVDLSQVHDPRALIIIPAILVGVGTIIFLYNGISSTVNAGNALPSDNVDIYVIVDGETFKMNALYGKKKMELTDKLQSLIQNSEFYIMLSVNGIKRFNRVYRIPPLRNAETDEIWFNPDGNIYINNEAILSK
jgi:hypothetical protein